jgi:hypothetical protein
MVTFYMIFYRSVELITVLIIDGILSKLGNEGKGLEYILLNFILAKVTLSN